MTPTAPQPADARLRMLGHDLRGRMNALGLCATAIDAAMPRAEQLEFLTHIEESTDKVVAVLDQLDQLDQQLPR